MRSCKRYSLIGVSEAAFDLKLSDNDFDVGDIDLKSTHTNKNDDTTRLGNLSRKNTS